LYLTVTNFRVVVFEVRRLRLDWRKSAP